MAFLAPIAGFFMNEMRKNARLVPRGSSCNASSAERCRPIAMRIARNATKPSPDRQNDWLSGAKNKNRVDNWKWRPTSAASPSAFWGRLRARESSDKSPMRFNRTMATIDITGAIAMMIRAAVVVGFSMRSSRTTIAAMTGIDGANQYN